MADDEGFDESASLRLQQFLDEFDVLLDVDPAAALRHIEAASPELKEEADVLLAQGEALFAARGPEAARGFLEPLVAAAPDLSDARHMLAEVLEELGDERGAIEQHLFTLRLDTQLDELSGEPELAELDAMAEVAETTLASLPETVRKRLGNVAVMLETRPSHELVASGFDSRALGLFEGPTSVEQNMLSCPPEPTRIVLYSHCLLDAFGGDEAELREQVRITVLHEVGHCLGLEEEDMARLGLD